MDRSYIYTEEQLRDYDHLWEWRDTLIGFGQGIQDILGSTGTYVTGFAASQTTSPSLTINIGAGDIYQYFAVDATAWGSLASDAAMIVQQGIAPSATRTLSTGGLTSGQSQWVLIEATFAQVDIIRADDPNGGVYPFINTGNILQPLFGPGGDGASLPDCRSGQVTLTVSYGTPSSGTPSPPTPGANNVPLYLIELTFGQTTITNGQILVAGPSVGPGVGGGYAQAPFLAGLLNAHHNGKAGQAPQINLATEIQGIAPLANLPVSNTSPPVVGGSITVGGEIPILSQGTVNPNGNVAGNVDDLFLFGSILYACTTSGSSSTAVWTPCGAGPQVIYNATFPYTINSNYATYMFDVSGGSGTVTLPAASTSTNAYLTTVKVDNSANTVTLNAAGTDHFIYGTASLTSIIINVTGQSLVIQPYSHGGNGYWVVIKS